MRGRNVLPIDHTMVSLDTALALLGFLVAGFAYAAWFKRERAALGFLWLLFLALGLGAGSLAAAAGWRLQHNLALVAYSWLPWNLLLLALLPPIRLRSWALVSLVVVLVLQLVGPLLVPAAQWAALPGLNERLLNWLPGGLRDLLSPIEPLVLVLAAVAFFVRWQLGSRFTDLALSTIATILLVGAMRPELLVIATSIAAALLFLSVIYTSHRMAFLDGLTGLPNRRSFDLAMATPPRRYAVALMDIDHFKRINDRFGHDVGDQVLRMVAARLRRLRGCRVFRYGGEEFVLLFRGGQVAGAADVCEQGRAAIADPPLALRSSGRPPLRPLNKARYREKVPSIKVTISGGLATNTPGNHVEAVVEAADKALYRAKRGGRNKLVVAK